MPKIIEIGRDIEKDITAKSIKSIKHKKKTKDRNRQKDVDSQAERIICK